MKQKSIILIIIFYCVQGLYASIPQWAQKFGGNSYKIAEKIVVDNNGDIYAFGKYNSSAISFNNSISLTNVGSDDIYLTKYNNTGICQWAQRIAGSSYEEAKSLSLDSLGNIIISGNFASSLLTFNNGITLTNSSSSHTFLAMYNNSGLCQWAVKTSGNSSDFNDDIAVDDLGNILTVGNFYSDTLYFNNGISLLRIGGLGSYIAKYNNSGQCQWASLIGGLSYDYVTNVAVSNDNTIYLAGNFSSDTIYFNNSISLIKSGMSEDGFVSKYSAAGQCEWSKSISGNSSDLIKSISVDSDNQLYILGDFYSDTVIFDNANSLNRNLNNDIFLAKYNVNGDCQWAKSISGNNNDNAKSITINNKNNVYVGLYFKSDTLNLGNGILVPSHNTTSTCGVIAKFSTNGTCKLAKRITGTSNYTNDYINCVFADSLDNVYLAGVFESSVLNFGNSISLTKSVSNGDGFIAKYEKSLYPTVFTSSVANLNPRNIQTSGNVTDEGGSSILIRGICWSTVPSPDINADTTDNGNGLGNFVSEISNLLPSYKYYYRAYATNSNGTSYGEEYSFTTLKDSSNYKKFSFQGVMRDSLGNIIQNGNYAFTFRIYSSFEGGDSLWSETKNITISNGIIDTYIGDVNMIDLPFDTSYWFSIQVSTDSQELSPRQQLTGPIYKNGGFGK